MAADLVRNVVEQHAYAASILWLRREVAVRSPHYSLTDLASLDEQLVANLDGLRIAGAEGWRICVDELRWGDPGEVFAAAVLASDKGDQQDVDYILQGLHDSNELQRAFVAGCGWVAEPCVEQILRAFSASDALVRYVALAARAVHRTAQLPMLRASIGDDDERVRARALRAVGEMGGRDLIDDVRDAVNGVGERPQVAASWTMARLARDEEAIATLRRIVEQSAGTSDRALRIVVRVVPLYDAENWIHTLASLPTSHRNAITAAGLLGSVKLVPWLIDTMEQPRLARVAGEAFTMITGLAVAERPFEGEWPEGFEAGPNDDPADENVEMDPDENLPWPDRQAIADWWVKHRDAFRPGVRYLLGRPIDDEVWLEQVLRHGYQRQRAAAALELAIRRSTEPLFNIAAPAWRQKKLLGLM